MASVRAEPAPPRGISIRAHLVRLVLALALPLAALVAWHLYDRAQADLQNARQQVFHLAQVTASETTRFLGQAQNILNGLAARPAVRALDASRCDPILEDFLSLAPRFSNIVTVAIDGRVVCSAVPLAGPTRLDPDILLNRLRGPDQLTVGKITPGAITGRWAVPIARPLLDAQGNVAGTVSLSVDLLKLSILPSVEGLPAETSTGIIDFDGTVLARALHPDRFVGTNQGNREGTRKLLTEKSGVDEEISIDGILRVRAFTPIPGTDWIAVASVPASAVYAGARARIAASAMIAIAILFAVLLFAFRLGRQIHGPIAAIADTADEVAAGNLAARAPLADAAEIAHVSVQFNAMLDKRARTESDLRDSEARFRSLTELSSDYYWEQDEQLRFIARVGNAYERDAIPLAEVVGKKRWELPGLNLTEEDWQRHRADLDARREFRNLEILRPGASGELRWISSSGRPIFDAEGRFRGYRGIGRDITERKLAEAALRKSEARFRSLSNLTSDWYWEQDEEFRFVSMTFNAEQKSGAPIAQSIGKRRWELPDAVPLSGTWAEHRALIEAHQPYRNFEYRRSDGAGSVLYQSVSGEPVFDDDGAFRGYRGTAIDISDRKRLDAALRESVTRTEALTRRLLEAQETERRRIARELHDEVGGVLTAVKLNLYSLRGKGEDDPGEAALADGLALVDGAIQSVRSLSLDLRPAVLDDLGLIPALKWYCGRQAKRGGLQIDLALDAIDLKGAPQLESACFRIVQEALTNTLRHAHARRVEVTLHRGEDGFALEISDDGAGFDASAARQQGREGESSGLHGMEQRANLLGGRLTIDSVRGKGTRVRAEFDMPEGGFA